MPVSVNPIAGQDGRLRSSTGLTKRTFASGMNAGLINIRHHSNSNIADGVTDARAALLAADAEGPVLLPPGTYAISDDMALTNAPTILPGAKLKPASGKTIAVNSGYTAEDLQHVFDLSAGGAFTIAGRSYVTPEHFGALGNGIYTEDDYIPLQAALDVAIANSIDLYSSRNYYISQSLVFDCTAHRSILWRGNGYEDSSIIPMNSMANTPLVVIDSTFPFGLHNSRVQDITLSGVKQNGARLDIIFDAQLAIGNIFDHVRFLGADRICFKLGFNYTNTFLSCFFQPGVIANDKHFTHGIVVTHATNNANVFIGCTMISANGFGYVALAGGQGNSFINCRPESCKAGGYFINGGRGWLFDGYVEAAGYSTEPHQFITQYGSGLLPGGPWTTNSVFVFNGSGIQFLDDVTTTASGTATESTVIVGSATGLFIGAKVEVNGAGTAGDRLRTRITAIAGTTITLADALETTVAGVSFIQHIQPTCDYSTTYPPKAVTVNSHGWSTVDSGAFYSIASLEDSQLSMPGAGDVAPVTAGTNKIIKLYGNQDGVIGNVFNGGPLPASSTGDNYLEVLAPNTANVPGNPALAFMTLPWANKTVAVIDPSDYTPTNGTITDSGWTYQGKTLWLFQSTTGNLITNTINVDFAEYPEFSNKYLLVEVDCIDCFSPYSSPTFYDGGTLLYGLSSEGLIPQSGAFVGRPAADVSTTGTITAATSSLSVASATGLQIGKIIVVHAAGVDSSTVLIAKITNIVGTTITLDTAAGTTATDVAVSQPEMKTTRRTFKAASLSVSRYTGALLYIYSYSGHKYGSLITEVRIREVGS